MILQSFNSDGLQWIFIRHKLFIEIYMIVHVIVKILFHFWSVIVTTSSWIYVRFQDFTYTVWSLPPYFRKKHMVEINFLCVHKKLRSKRVAPVLIREITRRVHEKGLFQAVYTAGVVLPKPVACCRSVWELLNPPNYTPFLIFVLYEKALRKRK